MNYLKIKTYEDACLVNKQEPNQLPDVSNLPANEAKDVINSLKLKRIIRAINTDENGKVWQPNWYDDNQTKYTIWHRVKATKAKPSGVGFSHSFYGRWYSSAGVGSRLCLESSDKVMHLQKYFEELLIETQLIIE